MRMFLKKENHALCILLVVLLISNITSASSYAGSYEDDLTDLGLGRQLIENFKATQWSQDFRDIDGFVDIPNNAPISTTCQAYLELYAELAQKFTQCSIKYARPLRFCENCVEEFVRVKSVYKYLSSGTEHDDHGNLCRDLILNADRTQVAVLYNQFINDLWDTSDCNNCFEIFRDNNGTVEARLDNDTVHFIHLMNETQRCFDNFTQGSQILPLNMTGNLSICSVCQPKYAELNNHYYHMGARFNDHICMDIVDTMNYTRLAWSNEFDCTNTRTRSPYAVCLPIFGSALATSFYVITIFYSKREKQPIIQKQKRLDNVRINDPSDMQESSTETDIRT